jgi:hypothetical protein
MKWLRAEEGKPGVEKWVRFHAGHKNSKGELAEWVVVSSKTGAIISSYKTKDEAVAGYHNIVKQIHMH